ncbi:MULTISPECIES: hypothetical protein [Mesobacillus]|uniref:Uncharacterized protein n=1 Tax=Mesobacillus selenatarsenatis TaxID=388741 RepID=A0A846TEW2_9BACI|nr:MULTISPECIES: hypothetical protein [Mesobacillus]NKE04724.1 hypothetical protein [Mesobacillus selenatarsenatis]
MNHTLTQNEEQLIIDALKNCLRETYTNMSEKFETIHELDTLVSSFMNDGTVMVVLYKASDCVLMLGSPVELPQYPMYTAQLDQREGFKAGANSEIQGTKYEAIVQFAHACLESSVKRG